MQTLHNISKISDIENEISIKQEKLEILKKENFTLSNIHKIINKGNPDNKELKILQDKLRNLKNELKYSKESLKLTDTNLKHLNKQILELSDKNAKIKECIEIKKTIKNLENEESLIELSEKIKFLEYQIQSEEKLFKQNIDEQNLFIMNLNDDMQRLNLKIKGKEQKIKIEEMKIREINKLKRQEEKKMNNLRLQNKNSNMKLFITSEETNLQKQKRPFNIKFVKKVEDNTNRDLITNINSNFNGNLYNKYVFNYYRENKNSENLADILKDNQIETENKNEPSQTHSTNTGEKDNKNLINQIQNLSKIKFNCFYYF